MYCVIQFYIQLRTDLKDHRPFLKVLAIKLVIFLSFWQSFMISILTSATFNVVHTTAKIAYPDLKVGIPSLLLCIEMAIFAILHLFAFPWKPYQTPRHSDYPMSPLKNEIGPKQGGPLGVYALVDAMNPWDMIKGFARGMRWLFCGVRKREQDSSYKINFPNENDMALEPTAGLDQGYKRPEDLPIAEQFRRSKFGMPASMNDTKRADDEGAGLIDNAQPEPYGYKPANQRYDANGQDINPYESSPDRLVGHNPTPGTVRRGEKSQLQDADADIGMAMTSPTREAYPTHRLVDEPQAYQSHVIQPPYTGQQEPSQQYRDQLRAQRAQAQGRAPPDHELWEAQNQNQPIAMPDPAVGHPAIHNALWGQRPPPQQGHSPNQF